MCVSFANSHGSTNPVVAVKEYLKEEPYTAEDIETITKEKSLIFNTLDIAIDGEKKENKDDGKSGVTGNKQDQALVKQHQQLQHGQHQQIHFITPLATVLSSCARLGALDIGNRLHPQCIELGFFDYNPIIITAVLDMYVKCSLIGCGRNVFDDMPERDQFIGLIIKSTTFDHITDEFIIRQSHGFMVPRGLDQNNVLLSKFIETCSFLGFRDYGLKVFTRKTEPDIYLYNTVIKALSQPDSAKDAILLYNKIQAMGFRPDTYSFPFVLKSAVHLSAVEVGTPIHGQTIRTGFDSDVHVVTGFIPMYSSCGFICEARKLFDNMRIRNVVFWNAMIVGYAKAGDVENARELFEKMPERNANACSWQAYNIISN